MQELEKILEEIEKQKSCCLMIGYAKEYNQGALKMAEVIEDIIHKHMGNDGWIPVEEHLPEDGQIVIISMYNNIKWVTIGSQCGGVWKPYNYITDLGIDVKAWRYLPDPYRSEKGE